jgi:hypothetical protein
MARKLETTLWQLVKAALQPSSNFATPTAEIVAVKYTSSSGGTFFNSSMSSAAVIGRQPSISRYSKSKRGQESGVLLL